MKSHFGSIFSTLFLLALLWFAYHVMSGTTTCERISNATGPIRGASRLVSLAIAPWTDKSGQETVDKGRKGLSGAVARFLQRYNGNVRCSWDDALPPADANPLFSGQKIPDLPSKGK